MLPGGVCSNSTEMSPRSYPLLSNVWFSRRGKVWDWIKDNIIAIRKLHEGTGGMSRLALAIIPILGIGRIAEIEKFFSENRFPEAEKGVEAGIEKLKIYDRFVNSL